MKLIVAKQAGFCFGVKRAVEAVYSSLDQYEKIYTYGPLIHNEAVVDRLKDLGAPYIVSLDEIKSSNNAAVVIRSHGVSPKIFSDIEKWGVAVVDATCPFVKRVQQKAFEADTNGRSVIIIGKDDHPEVVGIKGWANDNAFVLSSKDDVNFLPKLIDPIVVAQTTIEIDMWNDITKTIKDIYPMAELFMSICETTLKRQKEAMELSKKCDRIIVVGGKNSSNTQKLYSICKKYCKFVYLIEEYRQLLLEKINDDDIIGLVAGASTPDWMIMEVERRMSELVNTPEEKGAEMSADGVEQSNEVTSQVEEEVVETVEEVDLATLGEEDFLKELDKTFVTIRKGQTIKGTVVQVTDDDVSLNIAYKSDGLIARNDLPIEAGVSAKEVYKIGDEVEAQVLSMNDGEGRVKLSLKRMQDKIDWQKFLDVHTDDSIYDAKITRVVKSGVMARIGNYEAFIPVSHLSLRFVEDMKEYVGKEVKVKIIDINKDKRRFVASLKDLLIIEARAKKQELIESFEKGQKIDGKVKKLTDFGAFIDVGGVDGLLHKLDMSWTPIKHPSEVLEEGQAIEVVVLNTDAQKKKISLGLKQLQAKPWDNADEKYPVGSTVKGKVVRITSFGAFVSLELGIDGLVHISQVANKRIDKVEDMLSLGDEIEAKVMEVKAKDRKISLSIRELLEPEPVVEAPERTERAERPAKKTDRPKRERQERVVIPDVQEATFTLADLFPKVDE